MLAWILTILAIFVVFIIGLWLVPILFPPPLTEEEIEEENKWRYMS